MEPDLEVSRDIAAPPAAIFGAITDITRMGEWSPETYAAEWNEGFDHAELDARFTGHNRNGEHEWSTEAKIVELVPDRRFFFDCEWSGFVYASWGYEIEAIEGGSRVTECWQDHRPDDAKQFAGEISGVYEREPHNRAGMEATLAALAAALE